MNLEIVVTVNGYLQYGSLAGLTLAIILARVQNLLNSQAIANAIAQGVRVVLPAMLLARHVAVTADDPILLACIGSVLAEAIFGDHCSPISDTTILSSQSCGCDHIAHVVTQLPYALTVAAVGVVLGTLPIGWGVSV